MRRLGRKRTLAETMQTNHAATRYYALMAGKEPPTAPALPPKREIVNRSAPETLEAAVMTAVGELLARHPNVLLAVRQNSGAASYEAKSGKWAPVWFYRVIRAPEPVRLPDYWGILRDGTPFWIEVKKTAWQKPTDQREREQAAFLRLMVRCGHRAGFARSADEALGIVAA